MDKTKKENAVFRSLIKDYINHAPQLVNHVIIWKNSNTYFISPYIVQGIHKTLTKYPDTQFIILKLTIVGSQSFNHANIIIYDVMQRYVERFDPYGNAPFYESKQIDYLLESFFKDYFPGVKYLSPAQTTDGASFQIFSDEQNQNNYVENDPAGFCIAWCLWYLETRINNINIAPRALTKRTLHQIVKSNNKIKDYIRDYSHYLDTEKNKVLQRAGIPYKYWYSRSVPMKIYKRYLKHIRNSFEIIS